MSANEANEQVDKMSQEALNAVAVYTKAELSSIAEDYRLLQLMNNVTREKYTELSVYAQRLIQQSSNLSKQSVDVVDASFQPYIEQVNEIEQRVDYLDSVTEELERYTKALEEHFHVSSPSASANRMNNTK